MKVVSIYKKNCENHATLFVKSLRNHETSAYRNHRLLPDISKDRLKHQIHQLNTLQFLQNAICVKKCISWCDICRGTQLDPMHRMCRPYRERLHRFLQCTRSEARLQGCFLWSDHRSTIVQNKRSLHSLSRQEQIGSNLSCFEIRFHRVVRSDLVTLREGCCNKHSWSAFVGRPQVQNNCQGSLIHKGNWPPPAPEIRNQKCHWNKYYCCQGEEYTWQNIGRACGFDTFRLRGGVKKLFFYFQSKGGGGVSANPKNPYQKIFRFFWPKGGGRLTQSKRVLSEKVGGGI